MSNVMTYVTFVTFDILTYRETRIKLYLACRRTFRPPLPCSTQVIFQLNESLLDGSSTWPAGHAPAGRVEPLCGYRVSKSWYMHSGMPPPLPPAPPCPILSSQVKCRHSSWTGSKHATRCANHYQKQHGYHASGGGASSSGDALSQDAGTSSNASTASAPSGRGLKQLHITLNTHRRLSKQQQRDAEYRMVLMQLRYGLSLQAMSSPELQAVMDAADCQLRIPCRKTLQRRQQELSAHTKRRVVRRLSALKTVTNRVDMWEDDGRHISYGAGDLWTHHCRPRTS